MNGHRQRVLLVEGHQPTRQSLRRRLSDYGWEVAEAATIAEGLAYLDVEDPPDCLILELELPDGRGESLLRRVRVAGLPTRVVVNSGAVDAARLGELAYMRPDTVLAKPAVNGGRKT
jgi:DNA-binding response OmpR family regulator